MQTKSLTFNKFMLLSKFTKTNINKDFPTGVCPVNTHLYCKVPWIPLIMEKDYYILLHTYTVIILFPGHSDLQILLSWFILPWMSNWSLFHICWTETFGSHRVKTGLPRIQFQYHCRHCASRGDLCNERKQKTILTLPDFHDSHFYFILFHVSVP